MDLLENPFVTVPIASWVIAQLLKFLLAAIRTRKVDWNVLVTSGGMPSSHTAIMAALTTTALIQEGADSAIFGVTLVLALIVVYDALHVRRASGMHGQAIMQLVETVGLSKFADADARVITARGHKPNEVFAGGILGVGLALLLQQQQVRLIYEGVFEAATSAELRAQGAVFLWLLFVGVVSIIMGNKLGWPKVPSGKKVMRLINRSLILLPSLGLAVVAFAKVVPDSFVAYRVWPYIIMAASALMLMYASVTLLPGIRGRLTSEKEQFSKTKKQHNELKRRLRRQKRAKHKK